MCSRCPASEATSASEQPARQPRLRPGDRWRHQFAAQARKTQCIDVPRASAIGRIARRLLSLLLSHRHDAHPRTMAPIDQSSLRLARGDVQLLQRAARLA